MSDDRLELNPLERLAINQALAATSPNRQRAAALLKDSEAYERAIAAETLMAGRGITAEVKSISLNDKGEAIAVLYRALEARDSSRSARDHATEAPPPPTPTP